MKHPDGQQVRSLRSRTFGVVRLLALTAVLSSLLTVAVSAGIAVFGPTPLAVGIPPPIDLEGDWSDIDWVAACHRTRTHSFVYFMSLDFGRPITPPSSRGTTPVTAGIPRARLDPIPSWSYSHTRLPGDVVTAASILDVSEFSYGWPRQALVGRVIDTWSGTPQYEWCLPIGAKSDGKWRGVIPIRPIPAAFAFNSLNYSPFVLLGLLTLRRMLSWLRRCLRLRAGECPNCRYDLSGLTGTVCPECGGNLPRIQSKPKQGDTLTL